MSDWITLQFTVGNLTSPVTSLLIGLQVALSSLKLPDMLTCFGGHEVLVPYVKVDMECYWPLLYVSQYD